MPRPSQLGRQTKRIVHNERHFLDRGTSLFAVTGNTYKSYLNLFFNSSVTYYFDKSGDIFIFCTTKGELHTLGNSILTTSGMTTGESQGLTIQLIDNSSIVSNPSWMYSDGTDLHIISDTEEITYSSGDTTALASPLAIRSLSRLFPSTDSLYYEVNYPEE